MFRKKVALNRQEKRAKIRKIKKTLSKIRVLESDLHNGVNRLRARLALRSLHGYYGELKALGLVNRNSFFENVKAFFRGFKLWR